MARALRRALVVAAAAAALLGAWIAPSHGSVAIRDEAFHSRALDGTVRFAVYLPPDYDTSTRRFPVVYFLHGLPASPQAYRGIAFLGQALADRQLEAIVVAPQGARYGDTDPEYLDRGPGRNWETALARELPRIVDARFRTIAERRGRAVVGISAGGYGAMLIGLHHLDTFAAVESWSGYFHPTDPSGWHALDLHSAARNAHASAHAAVPWLYRALRSQPAFLGFYVGAGDVRFRAENEQLDRELRHAGVPHVFQVYAGGHAQSLWTARAGEWLELALAHLKALG